MTELGGEWDYVSPARVKRQPLIKWRIADLGAKYLLVRLDYLDNTGTPESETPAAVQLMIHPDVAIELGRGLLQLGEFLLVSNPPQPPPS